MRLSVRLLLALGAVLLLGGGIAGLVVVRETEGALRAQAIGANRHSGAAYSAALASHLEGAHALLSTAAGDPRLPGYRASATPVPALRGVPRGAALPQRELARRVLASSKAFDHVLLLEPDGTVFLVEPFARQASQSTANLWFLPWVREVVRGASVAISDLHISPSTGSPSVVVAAPVADTRGRVLGVLAGALDLHQFSAVGRVGGTTASDHGAGWVTDTRGLIIAHQGRSSYVDYQTDFSTQPAVAAALAGRTGAGEWFNSLDGERKLGAYLPLPGTGWAVVYAISTDVTLAPARALARGIATYVAVLALGMGGVGHLVLWRALRPLRLVTEASRSIALSDLPVEKEGSSRDEVAGLAKAFAAMQHRVNQREAEVRRHALALEDVNHELEAFSYSVSHDLRTPLRAIEGFSDILLEDHAAALDQEAADLLGRIIAAARRMGVLIDDLLTLSRAVRDELHKEPVDVSALCSEIVGQLRAAEPTREVDILIEPGIIVEADPRLLRSLVANVVGNAWKFTSKTSQARIEIACPPGSDGGDLCVRDNGVGFAMADASKVFGAFQRLHATSDFPGTGIGLAIVQRIAQRHGGRVTARAEPGQGASFLVTFGPLAGSGDGRVPPPPLGAAQTPPIPPL